MGARRVMKALFELPYRGGVFRNFDSAVGRDDVHCNARRCRRISMGTIPASKIVILLLSIVRRHLAANGIWTGSGLM